MPASTIATDVRGALKTATGATEGQIQATEDYILKTSLATGVAEVATSSLSFTVNSAITVSPSVAF